MGQGLVGPEGSLDQTGTTKIGRPLLSHSFMSPGLVTVFTSVVIALRLAKVMLR
jgi:anaerobic C4-dicarboxylate transporter